MSTLLSPAALSRRYGGAVTEKTLANWRWKRTGPKAIKIGGAVFYHLEDVEKYEARARKESARRPGVSPGRKSTRSLRGSKDAEASLRRVSPRSKKKRK